MMLNTQATEAATLAASLDAIALYRTMVTARVTNDLLKNAKDAGTISFLYWVCGT